MTSFAFILGVVPLVLSEGAGAEMRRTLGTAVFGGMLGVTLFGIFLTPVFYYVIQWVNDLFRRFPAARIGRCEVAGRSVTRSSRPAWAFGGSGIDLGRKLRINRSTFGPIVPTLALLRSFFHADRRD